jgi:hypothetical protein
MLQSANARFFHNLSGRIENKNTTGHQLTGFRGRSCSILSTVSVARACCLKLRFTSCPVQSKAPGGIKLQQQLTLNQASVPISHYPALSVIGVFVFNCDSWILSRTEQQSKGDDHSRYTRLCQSVNETFNRAAKMYVKR